MGSTSYAEHIQFNPPAQRTDVTQLVNSNNILLQMMPFKTLPSDRYKFSMEVGRDASISWRAINGTFNEGSAKLAPREESVRLVGTHMDYDIVEYQNDTNGQASQKLRNKINTLGIIIAESIIKGNNSTDPKSVNGVYRELAVANHYYIGGGAFELVDSANTPTASNRKKAVAMGVNFAAAGLQINSTTNMGILIKFIDRCIARMPIKPELMFMGSEMYLILQEAFRESNKPITTMPNQWGVMSEYYNGVLIGVCPKYEDGSEVMEFNELSPDGTSNSDCGSILFYKFDYDDEGRYYMGFDNGDVLIKGPKEKEDGVNLRWTLSRNVGHVMHTMNCVTRLGGVRQA